MTPMVIIPEIEAEHGQHTTLAWGCEACRERANRKPPNKPPRAEWLRKQALIEALKVENPNEVLIDLLEELEYELDLLLENRK